MNREELERFILSAYHGQSSFPWKKYPAYQVFRHRENRKWFALVMEVPKEKLGLPGTELLPVVNLKCDPLLIGSLRLNQGFFPAYHMNKENWITVALDGTVPEGTIKFLLEQSFFSTSPRKKGK